MLLVITGCKSCKTSSEKAQPFEGQISKPYPVPHIDDNIKAEKINSTTEQNTETKQQ